MPYKEAASWVCLTMFGAAAYFIFEWWGQERILVALAVGLIALIGLGYLVYQHHHPEAKLPSTGIWVWLPLVLTWCFVGYAISVDRQAPGPGQADIPEFDAQTAAIVEGYGLDTPESCYATVNGNALLTRQKGYRLAMACFIYDGREDILDAPYVQFSNLYDIRAGTVAMRTDFQQYFVEYRNQMHAIGIDVSVLNVPNGMDLTHFTTLRQARVAGVKILSLSVAASVNMQKQSANP